MVSSIPFSMEQPVKQKETGAFSLLHTDPVIMFAFDWELHDSASAVRAILAQLPAGRSYLLVGNSWTLTKKHHLKRTKNLVDELTQRSKHLVASLMANTFEEGIIWESLAGTAIHCGHSALLREDCYYPISDQPKQFDAIYDGRWANYKRHQLASQIQSLALIAVPGAMATSTTGNYSQRARAALAHATWLKSPWEEQLEYLSAAAVNDAYNRAKVGLCLSRQEGAMFASAQYLLAGLPVVTTQNAGGRDEFFDKQFVRWAEDDPRAVADAVAELSQLNLQPYAIRESVLARITQHRNRLLQFIQNAIDTNNGHRGRWQSWPTDLPNKFIEPEASANEVLRLIHQRTVDSSVAHPAP